MEGPLIAVPEAFTGRTDVGPNTEELARRLGEPRVLAPDHAAIRAELRNGAVVVSAECGIALATLPWLAEHRPDAKVLWLDAHPDCNTPETSPSGYAGGMPVAGATGHFDAGVAAPLLPIERIVFAGIRDVDPGERALLDAADATVLPTFDGVVDALGDATPVSVHLDCDVLDGYPAAFPVPGGPSAGEVRALLEAVARDREIVGVTVTAVAGPTDVPASVIEPLLRA